MFLGVFPLSNRTFETLEEGIVKFNGPPTQGIPNRWILSAIGFGIGATAGFMLAVFMTSSAVEYVKLAAAFGLIGAILGAVLHEFANSASVRDPKKRTVIGVAVGIAGSIAGIILAAWARQANSWPSWSFWALASLFATAAILYGAGIRHELGERQPQDRRSRLQIVNKNKIYVDDNIRDRYMPHMAKNRDGDATGESKLYFMARFHWTKAFQDTLLTNLVLVLSIWMALRRPGAEQLTAWAAANAKTFLLVAGALLLIWIGRALYLKRFKQIRAKFPLVFVAIGIIMLWVAIGSPGASTLATAFSETDPWRFWLIIASISTFASYWRWCDWKYSVIVVTDYCVRLMKRGPIWLPFMPARAAILFIREVNTAIVIETTGGKSIHRAGANIDAPGLQDFNFNYTYPMVLGQHQDCVDEINWGKNRFRLAA